MCHPGWEQGLGENGYMYVWLSPFTVYLKLSQHYWLAIQFSSVAQSCLTLCDSMDCSMPGFPVHHQHPELTQTHVHWVSEASQPSHPLSTPSPPAFNLSHHQGLFQWISSSHQVGKVLELQHQSFQWIFRTDLLSLKISSLFWATWCNQDIPGTWGVISSGKRDPWHPGLVAS